MKIIGHRGAAGEAPENTLRSAEAAIASGADGIEFDVRCVGQELVVIHDDSVDRTTHERGKLEAMSYEQVRAIRTIGGERIPRFDEMLEVACRTPFVNIEIKENDIVDAVLASSRQTVMALPHPPLLVFSSFHQKATEELATKIADDRFKLGVLCDQDAHLALELAADLKAWSIHYPREAVSERVVSRTHALGAKAYVYTVNNTEDYRACLEAGCDGIFTDFPRQMKSLAAQGSIAP